jgi:hypothetical protein
VRNSLKSNTNNIAGDDELSKNQCLDFETEINEEIAVESPDVIYTKIAGVTFDNRQSTISKLKSGEIVKLVREPNNIYDSNAIAVYNSFSQSLGYIQKELAKDLAAHLDTGEVYEASVARVIGGSGLSLGANLYIKKITGFKPIDIPSRTNARIDANKIMVDKRVAGKSEKILRWIMCFLEYPINHSFYEEASVINQFYQNRNHLIYLRTCYWNNGTYNQFINSIKNIIRAYYADDKITDFWDMQLQKELLKSGIDAKDVSIMTILSVMLTMNGLTDFAYDDSITYSLSIMAKLGLPF